MGLARGDVPVKYLLIIFNIVIVISGIVFISEGAWVLDYYLKYQPIFDKTFFSVPAFFIVTGSIILIASIFGWFGAVKKNHCMAITFSGLFALIFILEVAAGIGGYLQRNRVDEVEGVLRNELNVTMRDYANHTENTALWDGMQREFHCCGVHNYSNWNDVLPNNNLPNSCCFNKAGDFGGMNCSSMDTENVYKEGCLEKIGEFIEGNAVLMGRIGIGIAVVQLGIILACCLAWLYEKVQLQVSVHWKCRSQEKTQDRYSVQNRLF